MFIAVITKEKPDAPLLICFAYKFLLTDHVLLETNTKVFLKLKARACRTNILHLIERDSRVTVLRIQTVQYTNDRNRILYVENDLLYAILIILIRSID